MRLVVFTVGRKRDGAVDELCAEYLKRSRRFLPFELRDCKSIAAAWSEAEALGGPVVLLDERGKGLDSESVASWLGEHRDRGTRALSMVIGDADGFDDADRRRADSVLSLSAMTLAHRLALVVLCEQLYRAGTILAGHPYHRG